MPQTNYTPIQHYRSADSGSVPLAANLADGELAINTADVAVYTMNSLGTVKSVMNNPAGLKYPTADGTANQVVKTDGSGNLGFMSASSLAALVLPYVYPIGSIYANDSNSANPNTILGFGTWTAIEERVLAGYKSGSTYFGTAGAESGTADSIVVSHNHSATSTSTSTVTDPGHSHYYDTYDEEDPGTSMSAGVNASGLHQTLYASTQTTGVTVATSTSTSVATEGVDGTGKNLQPYRTVYLWRRTA